MIRIPENIVKFSNGNLDLYKAWGDYWNHYRAEFMKKNVDYDRTVSFAEKTDKLDKKIKEEINKIAGTNNTNFSEAVWMTNPNYRWATFAVINSMVDLIIPQTVIEDFGNFSEVKNGAFGDSFVFDIKSGDLFFVTKGGGAKRHAFGQRQFTNQVALIPENRMITVESDMLRILAGKENLAEYAMKVALAIETDISIDVYTALDNTFSTLPTAFKETAYTASAFTRLAQKVTAYNGGAQAVVFGTKAALSTVLPSNDYLKMQLGDIYNRLGYLTTHLGVDMYEIPQRINWSSSDYSFAIDDTRLYFISTSSQKLVKICFEGETLTIADSQFQNANLTQSTTLQKRYAVGLVSNAKYAIMDLA